MRKDDQIVKVFERGSGDKFPVTFTLKDGTLMVNATEMGKAFGETKKPIFFLRAKGTREYINELKRSADYNFGGNKDPYITIKGGKDVKNQGTWMHEKLALKYASWIAPKFELWVYNNIIELIKTGKVELPRPNMLNAYEHLDEQTQRNNTKDIAKKIYATTNGDVKQIPLYHHNALLKIIGCGKKDIMEMAKISHVPQKIRVKGAKEVIRFLYPAKACVLSMVDNIIASTPKLSIDNQSELIDKIRKGEEMFKGLLEMGIRPKELN